MEEIVPRLNAYKEAVAAANLAVLDAINLSDIHGERSRVLVRRMYAGLQQLSMCLGSMTALIPWLAQNNVVVAKPDGTAFTVEDYKQALMNIEEFGSDMADFGQSLSSIAADFNAVFEQFQNLHKLTEEVHVWMYRTGMLKVVQDGAALYAIPRQLYTLGAPSSKPDDAPSATEG